MNIGERLKRYRTEKKMTQEEVAYRAGVTVTSVSRWENGVREPTFRDVEKIAAALGVTMEELTREHKRGTGIRKIIDGKLYDTENALILFKFRRRYQDPLNPLFFGKDMVHNEWEDAQYIKTERGAYLYYCPKGRDGKRGRGHDPETGRGRIYPDIRSGRGRMKGGKRLKAAVIATIILTVLFGGAAYIAVAGTLIIYALGNNKATKRKRTIFGILGAVMFWSAIYTVVQIIKFKNGI